MTFAQKQSSYNKEHYMADDLQTQLDRLKKLHALRQEELQQVKELVDKMAAQKAGSTDNTGTRIETASIEHNSEKRKI